MCAFYLDRILKEYFTLKNSFFVHRMKVNGIQNNIKKKYVGMPT